MIHPQSGDRLEHVQNQFAFAESEQHRRHGAQFHSTGCQGDKVRRDSIELHHHHANDGGSLGNVVGDAEKFFDSEAVRGFVEER